MRNLNGKQIGFLAQYAFIRALQFILSVVPYRLRGWLIGGIAGTLVPLAAGPRRRMQKNLDLVYPDMDQTEKKRIMRAVAANAARSLSELLMNAQYSKRHDLFQISGPGLDVLKKAKAEDKGALIISAHFGQWEAIRHVLMAQGLETGAIYRENSNPYYEGLFLRNIKFGGEPIVKRSSSGNRVMLKHLRSGGFFALLTDQKTHNDATLPFLGHDAWTTTTPAQLGLKMGLPVVPAFATRRPDGVTIDVEFEDPIAPSSVEEMTIAINNRIEARIRANPGQWYWMHRRWR